MPQKCETISHYCPTPYRDPRKRASSLKTVWRFTTMHLKPYPKPQKKEIRELGQGGTQTFHVDQQGIIRTEWGVRQACSHIGLPGNGTANRCPLSDVSTNTLCCATNNCSTQPTRGHSWPCKSKASCPDATFPSSLHLLSTSAGLENEGSLRIYQEEDGEASLDIWAVIKPGNTKEKIAIFTAQKGSQTVAGGSNKPSDRERTNQDTRTISMKSKGCWHGDWCVAKRRKRSGNSDKPKTILQQNTEIRMSPMTKENSDPHSDMAREVMRTEGEEGEKTLSVVEMVAYLEQRASVQQIESKPPLRSSSTIILSKAGALLCLAEQVSRDQQLSEVHEEEESVRVLDMVAKLESQCLSRQSLGEGGNLSRSNSLQRRVGRVLLAGCEPCSMSALSRLPPDNRAEGAPEQMPSDVDLPECPPNAHVSVQTSNSESFVKCLREKQEVGNEAYQETKSIETETMKDQVKGINDCKEEPLPGMLFFACSSPKTLQKEKCEKTPMLDDIKPSWNGQENEHTGALPLKQVLNPLLATLSPTGEHHSTLQNNGNVEEAEVVEVSGINKNHVPLRRLVSHEFLETRFKIQLLLEPQQYMAFLPHHIIVKIFSLLPTKSLAALKCTCLYFKFIIENYGVRPADSRWVSDPHYKDDPCKQCKKRYKRGDVSLCRWHHKPFCQALPYGPGYWMCCREPRKDTPGCNVGLHDNRWVPTFHSINMPIYKKSRDNEEDV